MVSLQLNRGCPRWFNHLNLCLNKADSGDRAPDAAMDKSIGFLSWFTLAATMVIMQKGFPRKIILCPPLINNSLDLRLDIDLEDCYVSWYIKKVRFPPSTESVPRFVAGIVNGALGLLLGLYLPVP